MVEGDLKGVMILTIGWGVNRTLGGVDIKGVRIITIGTRIR